MNEIITVQNVRGYIDAEGTAWLNVEDVARGLGFVMIRKERVTADGDNYSAVRWDRVNGYLQEFGYDKEVGKDDFIPENMFYLLAMKASNEVAKKFQLKIANEILPAIRKTGSYSVRPNVITPCADMIIDVKATAENICALIPGVKTGIAIAQAIEIVSAKNNLDLNGIKLLLPPAEHDTGYLNATQIGEKLGLGKGRAAALKANKMLETAAFQFRDGNDWRLTDEGSVFGEELPYSRNGHSGYQIRWNQNIIDALAEQDALATF